MNCKNCNKEFNQKHKTQKFCSRSCSASYNNRGVRRHGQKPTICINCGKKTDSYKRKYCSQECFHEFQYKEYIKKWKHGEVNGMKGKYQLSGFIRRFLFKKYNNKCARCGWSEVNPYSKKIPLEAEHIDGDYKNCKEENLILICPNCHSLTSTFRNLNKGNGRKARRKYDL